MFSYFFSFLKLRTIKFLGENLGPRRKSARFGALSVCVLSVLFTYLVMVGDRSKVLLDVGYSLQPWELGLESVCRVPYWVAFHCCPRLSKRILIVKKKKIRNSNNNHLLTN